LYIYIYILNVHRYGKTLWFARTPNEHDKDEDEDDDDDDDEMMMMMMR